MFWTLVVAAMAAVGVLAVLTDPSEPPRTHPRAEELFDDAVALRHTLASALRTGDTAALRAQAGTLTERWDPDGAPDHTDTRAAAVATLGRLAEAADGSERGGAWRDRLVAEADLLAALGAAPEDPAVIELARTGFDGDGSRTTPPELGARPDLDARLAEALPHDALDELRARLAERGAPELPHRPAPTLEPLSVEDLPR